jgi:DNA-directed RNA polymerase specialized sigma24 family protein
VGISKFTFEEKLAEIDELLAKRRQKWTLNCASIDYDDVCQIIRVHINKKWKLWDQTKPLANWVSTIISHQISNLLRNNYLHVAPPCSRCAMNQGAGLCGLTKSGEQCSECPLYKKWQKNKQAGFNIKIARSIDDVNSEESFKTASSDFDWGDNVEKFHRAMEERLPKDLFSIYKLLYIDHRDESEVAAEMGFRTKESGRTPGYKQIHNIKKKILEVAKEVVNEH